MGTPFKLDGATDAPLIRLTKQFGFEAAHALWNYDGACRNIHGHSYLLFVTLAGRPLNDPENPKHGMVIDFSVLKKIVHDQIIGEFDHTLMINAHSPHAEMVSKTRIFGKVLALPYQPTCENLIDDFAQRLIRVLPKGVALHSLRLHETTTSYAEWHASDNPPGQKPTE
jgi:6-pyruvoyl tetrahydropterin synthase/QueD family protein